MSNEEREAHGQGSPADQIAQHNNNALLTRSFHEQAERWKSETQHWSSVTRMLAHPSYLRIIGLSRLSTGNEN